MVADKFMVVKFAKKYLNNLMIYDRKLLLITPV
jgi:hypothetical protein